MPIKTELRAYMSVRSVLLAFCFGFLCGYAINSRKDLIDLQPEAQTLAMLAETMAPVITYVESESKRSGHFPETLPTYLQTLMDCFRPPGKYVSYEHSYQLKFGEINYFRSYYIYYSSVSTIWRVETVW